VTPEDEEFETECHHDTTNERVDQKREYGPGRGSVNCRMRRKYETTADGDQGVYDSVRCRPQQG
jgi:hypothetical protein